MAGGVEKEKPCDGDGEDLGVLKADTDCTEYKGVVMAE